MREGVFKPAPAKAGKRVSWAWENREVPSLALGFTVPVQRKLPVPVAALPKGSQLCVTCEMSHLRQCVDGGLPLEHASLQERAINPGPRRRRLGATVSNSNHPRGATTAPPLLVI